MNTPFADLSRLQTDRLFDLLGVHIFKYNKKEEILPTIKNENIICIVTSGSAQIVFIEYNGNEIIIENLEKDSLFGTYISTTNNENCHIIAKEDTEVVVIDYNKLMNPQNLRYPYFNTFFRNIFDIINNKFKNTNERIRILEKKQIREKLLEYFDIEYKKNRSRNIVMPFTLKDLADYIAVNRSAMFRELKHLKDEGFIEIKSKKITLLYK
ncbi:MAG: Crp/Fnr family transcriptional regulator [Clostridia bacterium]|nr:Crp/Fnr family transcriptional regulator [Clostridia bacterium]